MDIMEYKKNEEKYLKIIIYDIKNIPNLSKILYSGCLFEYKFEIFEANNEFIHYFNGIYKYREIHIHNKGNLLKNIENNTFLTPPTAADEMQKISKEPLTLDLNIEDIKFENYIENPVFSIILSKNSLPIINLKVIL